MPALGVGGQAELATFRGKVVDAEGKPVADATVVLEDKTMGGTVKFETNDKGTFYRRGLRPSEYTLTITKDGYMVLEVPLDFRAGEEKREEFRMVASMSGAETAFKEGIEAFNAGNLEAAAKAFEEVTRLSPETPEGHTNLALAYIQLGNMAGAVQELEKAAELSADFRTWAQLGMVYVQADRLQAAARAFETALEKEHDAADPIAYECWMALGSLYFAEGRVPDSVNGLRERARYRFELGGRDGGAREVLLQSPGHGEVPGLLPAHHRCPGGLASGGGGEGVSRGNR